LFKSVGKAVKAISKRAKLIRATEIVALSFRDASQPLGYTAEVPRPRLRVVLFHSQPAAVNHKQ